MILVEDGSWTQQVARSRAPGGGTSERRELRTAQCDGRVSIQIWGWRGTTAEDLEEEEDEDEDEDDRDFHEVSKVSSIERNRWGFEDYTKPRVEWKRQLTRNKLTALRTQTILERHWSHELVMSQSTQRKPRPAHCQGKKVHPPGPDTPSPLAGGPTPLSRPSHGSSHRPSHPATTSDESRSTRSLSSTSLRGTAGSSRFLLSGGTFQSWGPHSEQCPAPRLHQLLYSELP